MGIASLNWARREDLVVFHLMCGFLTSMSIVRIMFGLITLGLFLNAELASGQNQTPPTSKPPVATTPSAPPPPDGVPAKPGRPAVSTLPNPASHPGRGAKPDHPQPPDPVKAKLIEFKAAREKYLST